MEPIDIVIPWVDDTDPKWKAERAKYQQKDCGNDSNMSHYYRDWDTLRYVFRSIETNMPWVRYIHFLTYGHLPEWLNRSNPKLKVHNHSDFFSKESALPVFSSHPIEMNIMNIDGLAERFIYFNDDTLVGKPLNPDRFFRGNFPVDYLVWDLPRGGWLYDRIRIKDAYADICKNSIQLILGCISIKNLPKKFLYHSSYPLLDKIRNFFFDTIGVHKWIKVNHHPQAHTLSNLKKCHTLFEKTIDETSKQRFRTHHDVNQYIFRNYALMTGKFEPYHYNDSFCFVLSSLERYVTDRHYLFEKALICLNDSPFLKESEYPQLKQKVDEDLANLFPIKSSFEI